MGATPQRCQSFRDRRRPCCRVGMCAEDFSEGHGEALSSNLQPSALTGNVSSKHGMPSRGQ